MSKRLTIYAQILLIIFAPILLLADTQHAKAEPPTDDWIDECGDTPGTDDTGLDKYSVIGTLGLEELILELREVPDTNDEYDKAQTVADELEKVKDHDPLTVKLYKLGAYGGDGSGEVYCEDSTGSNGGFRFDNVYPGQYQLVVYDAKQSFIEAIKGPICTGVGGFAGFFFTPGGLLGKAIGGFIGAAAGEYLCKGEAMLFTAYAFVDKKAENPTNNLIVDDDQFIFGSHIPITLTSKTTMSGVISSMTFVANTVIAGIVNLFADKINNDLIIIGNLTKNNDVVMAWANVRDAANVLLLVALLIIAFANAARFQIEAYTAKALIPRLVIAAIFINFSLFTTQIIIDFSNMLTVFLSGSGIHFYHILPISRDGAILMTGSGGAAATVGGGLLGFFFGGFILLIAAIAGFTVLLLLVVRIALLWVCAIFSPLIFLFGVLPFTRGLTSMWWKYLIQYAFMGPVMALILFVASRL